VNEFDKLELSTETLRDLSRDELGVVAGGVADSQATCHCPTINPVTYCFDVSPTILNCHDTILTCHCPN
jgi:hypothetical protein